MNNIKQMRVGRGMRQIELAALAGVSQPFLYDLENGNRNARPETWEKIAAALGCTVEEIKGGMDNDRNHHHPPADM